MDSSIQAVIFDVDGTLLDTETLSSEASDVELAKFDAAPIDWDLKRRIIGLPGPVWTDMVIKERNLHPLLTAEDLLVKWEANLDQMCPFVREVDGASVLMNQLKSLPIKLAVATSSRKNNFLHKAFNHHDLFCAMEVVVCGDDAEIKLGKPAPDIYLLAAHRLRVEPSRCVVLEDSISGIQAGLAAGMRVVACPDPRAFLPDSDSRAYLQRFKDLTPHVIQSFEELLSVDVSQWGLKCD